MPARRLVPLLVAALCWLAPARADDLDEDFQIWAPVVLQVDVVPKVLRAWAEVQPRFTNDAGQLGVVLWRPALGVYLHEWVTLWAGYAFVERLRPGDYAAEHRVWEQVQLAGALDADKRWKVLTRLRLEHRMREGLDPVAHRLRLLLRGQVALGDPAPPGVYLVAWDEVFVGLNTVAWGPTSGFDRNRSFVGLGVQPLTQLRLEAGYLFEVTHRRGDADELGVHALAVTLWIDL